VTHGTTQSSGAKVAAQAVQGTHETRVRPRDIRAIRLVRRRTLSALSTLGATAVLVGFDVCGLIAGVYAALALRELVRGGTPVRWNTIWSTETEWLPFLALVMVLVFSRDGLYGPRERRTGFASLLKSLTVVGVLTVAFAVGAGHQFHTYGAIPTAIVFSAAFVGGLRIGYDVAARSLLKLAHVHRRVLLLGSGESLAHLGQALAEDGSNLRYEVVGKVSSPSKLGEAIAGGNVDEIVVDGSLNEQDLLDVVAVAHREAIRVVIVPTAGEMLARRGRYVPGQAIPLYELRPPAFAGIEWVAKRTFDYAVAGLLILVAAPFLALLALLVKFSSPGPVFFVSKRVGLNEREFPMLKFRTMYLNAAHRQEELESVNEADGALFKLRQDPRVTLVGAFLRRFSLDELPQLINVLRGEMSLVGPRPLPMRDFRRLEPWHRKRYLVLPGMTGLWQVSGRSDLTFDHLVRLDFHYLETWSIWLDISILLRTIPAVVVKRGAY
jgi:exopolysaccharide biosynthesis polyprenyl glycosylphosphotransferase